MVWAANLGGVSRTKIFVKFFCKNLRFKPVPYLLTHIFKFLNSVITEQWYVSDFVNGIFKLVENDFQYLSPFCENGPLNFYRDST